MIFGYAAEASFWLWVRVGSPSDNNFVIALPATPGIEHTANDLVG